MNEVALAEDCKGPHVTASSSPGGEGVEGASPFCCHLPKPPASSPAPPLARVTAFRAPDCCPEVPHSPPEPRASGPTPGAEGEKSQLTRVPSPAPTPLPSAPLPLAPPAPLPQSLPASPPGTRDPPATRPRPAATGKIPPEELILWFTAFCRRGNRSGRAELSPESKCGAVRAQEPCDGMAERRQPGKRPL